MGKAAAKSVDRIPLSCGAHNMSQGRGLNLKNVVCHVPGRDASLRRLSASHGVPMEASTDGRSENFAVAVA